jgi:hypothetical protein
MRFMCIVFVEVNLTVTFYIPVCLLSCGMGISSVIIPLYYNKRLCFVFACGVDLNNVQMCPLVYTDLDFYFGRNSWRL